MTIDKKKIEASLSLIIYDPGHQYREIVGGLKYDGYTVIDASESTINGREKALDQWLSIGSGASEEKLVIYLPRKKPTTEEDKRLDPYQIFALGGAEFPDSDGEE